MSLETTKQHISKLIDKSSNILVAAPEDINGDALGSTLALTSALKRMGKNAQLITPKELPKKFEFLPKINSLSYGSFQEREFVLSIKNPDNYINKPYYKKEDGLLHIYLNAKKKILEKDFRLLNSHPFDLIFTVNSQDFENLGKSFEYNPELFYETTLINIDNHTTNENFGEINLVNITSSSVSEIVMELVDFLDRNLLDKEISTLILAGLIDATRNFQSSKTTPRTFNNAALLISRGADQQGIIRHFYKTKSNNFLRLWGQVLRRLSWNKKEKLIYGIIEQRDFQKTNTSPDFPPQLFEEIKSAFPEMKTAFLIWPFQKEIKGMIYSLDLGFLEKLVSNLNGLVKNNNLFFTANIQYLDSQSENKILNEAKQRILDLINKEL